MKKAITALLMTAAIAVSPAFAYAGQTSYNYPAPKDETAQAAAEAAKADEEAKTDETTKADDAAKAEEEAPPLVESEHTAVINGEELAYTARTGAMRITLNDQKCDVYYTAYTVEDGDDKASRPVTFAFNGGPGSASLWLHMGLLGPRRVKVDSDGFAEELPVPLIDNEYSILDMTDLVFIDPVETGYSRVPEGAEEEAFVGYKNDCALVGNFIRDYVNQNNRWGSPKYLFGESYGTVRAVGVCEYLYNSYGMGLNGLMLLSSANNYSALLFGNGNELPYATFLPSYASVAWYHKKLGKEYLDMSLEDFLSEVRTFVEDEYVGALFKGSSLTEKEKDRIAEKIAGYIGLPKEEILKHNLRVDEDLFRSSLMKDEDLMVGRIDGRITGPVTSGNPGSGASDPSSDEGDINFSAAMNRYMTEELGFQTDRPYILLNEATNQKWTWMGENAYVNQEKTIFESVSKNRFLKIWVLCGYYDLATAFYSAEWTYHHIFLNDKNKDRISFTYYPSGHMIYLHEESLAQFRKDAEKWYK